MIDYGLLPAFFFVRMENSRWGITGLSVSFRSEESAGKEEDP
jgi:hypothetical protein